MPNKSKETKISKRTTTQIFLRTALGCLISAAAVAGGSSLYLGHCAHKWMTDNLSNHKGLSVINVATHYGIASVTIDSNVIISTNDFPEIKSFIPNIPPYVTVIASTKFSNSTASTNLELLGDSAKMLSDYIQRNQLVFRTGKPSNYERNPITGGLDLPVSIKTTFPTFGSTEKFKYNTTIAVSDTSAGTGAGFKALSYSFGSDGSDTSHSLIQLGKLRIPTPHHKLESLLSIEGVKFSRIYTPDGLKRTDVPIESIDSGRLDINSVVMNTEDSDYRLLPVVNLQKLSATYNIGNDQKAVADIDKVKKGKVVNYPISIKSTLTAKNFQIVDTTNKDIDVDVSLSGISGPKLIKLINAYNKAVNGTTQNHDQLKQITTDLAKDGMNIDNISLKSDSDDGKVNAKLMMKINPSTAQLLSKNPLALIAGVDLRLTASMPEKFMQKTGIISPVAINKLIQMDFIKVTDNNTRINSDIHLFDNQLFVNGTKRTL